MPTFTLTATRLTFYQTKRVMCAVISEYNDCFIDFINHLVDLITNMNTAVYNCTDIVQKIVQTYGISIFNILNCSHKSINY